MKLYSVELKYIIYFECFGAPFRSRKFIICFKKFAQAPFGLRECII